MQESSFNFGKWIHRKTCANRPTAPPMKKPPTADINWCKTVEEMLETRTRELAAMMHRIQQLESRIAELEAPQHRDDPNDDVEGDDVEDDDERRQIKKRKGVIHHRQIMPVKGKTFCALVVSPFT